jgi:hypothetical protein
MDINKNKIIKNFFGITKMNTQDKEIEMLKKHQRPEFNGPGIWYCIHTKASKVKNYNDMLDAIKDIRMYIEGFKCENCRGHATEYEKSHPLKNCLECKHQSHKGGLEMCLFKWTVDFHNAVNARLNKPVIGYEMAYEFYSDKMYIPCDTGCGSEKETKTQVYFTKSVEKPRFKGYS